MKYDCIVIGGGASGMAGGGGNGGRCGGKRKNARYRAQRAFRKKTFRYR